MIRLSKIIYDMAEVPEIQIAVMESVIRIIESNSVPTTADGKQDKYITGMLTQRMIDIGVIESEIRRLERTKEQ